MPEPELDESDEKYDNEVREAALECARAARTIAEYINRNKNNPTAFEQANRCHQSAMAAAALLHMLEGSF